MSVTRAMLSALNLSYPDAAELLGVKLGALQDMGRGKMRTPPGIVEQLGGLFEAVEQAADEILADQEEICGPEALIVDVEAIPLPHRALREAAAARALLVIGPRLLRIVDEERER